MAKSKKIDKVFKAISDPTRREIFHILMVAGASLSLTQIAQEFDITRQGITKHVNILEEAGLVISKEQGRERFCKADPTPLDEIKDWIGVYDRFWTEKITALDQHLKKK